MQVGQNREPQKSEPMKLLQYFSPRLFHFQQLDVVKVVVDVLVVVVPVVEVEVTEVVLQIPQVVSHLCCMAHSGQKMLLQRSALGTGLPSPQ